MTNLTTKAKAFAKAYAESDNAIDAYCTAYRADRLKTETIELKAAALLADQNIAKRVQALRQPRQL